MLSCETQYDAHTSKHTDQAVKVSSQVAPRVQIVQQDYCSDIPFRRLAMAKKNPQLELEICFSPLVILNLLLLFYQQRRCLRRLQGRSFNNKRGMSRKHRASLVSCHRYPGRDGPVSVSDTNQTHTRKQTQSLQLLRGIRLYLPTRHLRPPTCQHSEWKCTTSFAHTDPGGIDPAWKCPEVCNPVSRWRMCLWDRLTVGNMT